jgi:hypothetical protein
MKYHIVHTDFLDNLVEDLNLEACNLGWKTTRFTAEALANDYIVHIAFKMLDKCRENFITDLNTLYESEDGDPSDVADIKQSIKSIDRTYTDLVILSDLEGVDYANPNHIASSIEFLSERLVAQLEAKANKEANYNEYYCKRLAEVLSELCQLIKEV